MSAWLKWPELGGPAAPPTSLQAPSQRAGLRVCSPPDASIWVRTVTWEVIPGGMLREWGNETEGRESDQYWGVPEQTTAGDTWAPSPWDPWGPARGTPRRGKEAEAHIHQRPPPTGYYTLCQRRPEAEVGDLRVGPWRQVAVSSSPRGTAQRASLLCFEEPLTASASTALLPWVLENNCLPQSLWDRSLGQPGGQARSLAWPGTPALGTWHVFNQCLWLLLKKGQRVRVKALYGREGPGPIPQAPLVT